MNDQLITKSVFSIPELFLHGRTGRGENGELALFWTGSGFEVNIKGSELWVTFEASYNSLEPWILVLIDGVVVSRQMIIKGVQKICILRNFDASCEHNVQIVRETQAMSDDKELFLVVKSVEVSSDLIFLPVKPYKYNIEFIGDSITSGEGLVGATSEMQWIPMWMSTQNNFAYLTAKALNADYRIVSQCGWGVCISWDGNKKCNIPDYYSKICGLVSGEKNVSLGSGNEYLFDEWKTDAVVINLGTNDGSGFALSKNADGSYKTEDMDYFEDKCCAFLRTVRAKNSDAVILWVYGMLGNPLEEFLTKAIEQYKAESGDKNIAYLKLSDTTPDLIGARGHPGPIAHKLAADDIVNKLKVLLA